MTRTSVRFSTASALIVLAACSASNDTAAPSGNSAAFVGSWALVATDVDGVRSYLDRSSIHDAGTRKVADIGLVGLSGRRLERLSFGCDDHTISVVSSIGDDVETSSDFAGSLPRMDDAPSMADYVCGRAKPPTAAATTLPSNTKGSS